MRIGLMRTNRQDCIQQQHPLLGPMGQISMTRERQAQILLQFLENIL